MTASLRMSFDVACSAEHAFSTWTGRFGSWWPSDHTMSRNADAAVVLQAWLGGRIYERTPDGREHDWGKITVWEPPARLAYLWHLGRDQKDATEVEICFLAQGPASTRIEIEHRGWDRLQDAESWRDRNQVGWQTLIPHFLSAAERKEAV
jgi:hypothetical protein